LPAEFRVDKEGSIEGYAAVFDKWADLGFFREKVRKGAFKKTIKEADIRALFNHDPNYVLGRNKAKTLDLAEDKHGLQFRVEPPETGWAGDLAVSIKREDINQASFGFQTVRDEWNHDADPAERELIEVRLFDVSVVTYPAYPQTDVSARSLGDMFVASLEDGLDMDEIDYMLEQLSELINRSKPVQEDHLTGDQEPEGHKTKTLVGLKRRLVEIEQMRII
jgi:HK97 family phage prohead protease